MSKSIAVLLIANLLMAGTATAQTRTAEQAIEASTATLNLPERLPGTISLTACDNGCPPALLQLTVESQFFLDRRAVTFVALRELSSKPNLNVAVFFEPQSKTITRIVVSSR